MSKMHDVDEPITINEKYLYAQVVRLDALCHMMSSLLEHIAKKEGIAVESNTVKETPKKRGKKE